MGRAEGGSRAVESGDMEEITSTTDKGGYGVGERCGGGGVNCEEGGVVVLAAQYGESTRNEFVVGDGNRGRGYGAMYVGEVYGDRGSGA